MKVTALTPLPVQRVQFAWSHNVAVPDLPGCYVIATYNEDVLYVGLATGSIRDRMAAHLETPAKRIGSTVGVPFWFYFLLKRATDVAPVERGWMNQSLLEDGVLPPLNRIYSPL